MHRNFLSILILFWLSIPSGESVAASTESIKSINIDDYIIIRQEHQLANKLSKVDQKVFTNSSNYASFIFFLFPDRKWIKEQGEEDLVSLFSEFYDFGAVIGSDNLAIMLIDKNGDIDTIRSAKYAHMLGRNSGKGPYIVYVKPRKSYALELAKIMESRLTSTGLKIDDLNEISNSELFDYFAIDFEELGAEYAEKLLQSMKIYLASINSRDENLIPLLEEEIRKYQFVKFTQWTTGATDDALDYISAKLSRFVRDCGFESLIKVGDLNPKK